MHDMAFLRVAGRLMMLSFLLMLPLVGVGYFRQRR